MHVYYSFFSDIFCVETAGTSKGLFQQTEESPKLPEVVGIPEGLGKIRTRPDYLPLLIIENNDVYALAHPNEFLHDKPIISLNEYEYLLSFCPAVTDEQVTISVNAELKTLLFECDKKNLEQKSPPVRCKKRALPYVMLPKKECAGQGTLFTSGFVVFILFCLRDKFIFLLKC